MVYIDDYNGKFGSKIMHHMIADSIDELHSMAGKIGLKLEWFQPKSFPHYDVTTGKKLLAVKFGARSITTRELGLIIMKMKGS